MYTSLLAAALLGLLLVGVYFCWIAPIFNPLRELCGPRVPGVFGNHMGPILEWVPPHSPY